MPRALKSRGRDGSENMDITAPVKPPEQRRRRRRGGFFLRFLGFMFAASMIVFIAVAGAAAFVLWKVSSELPDYEVLAKYEPPVMTRIHANDGELIAEFARERRIYVPITAIPDLRDQGLHLGRGQEFLSAWRPRRSGHHPRRRHQLEQRAVGPARGRRLDHHPAGGQELPA